MTRDGGNHVPVLIAGLGPVGLALAGDLGWRGVQCLAVEQSDGSIYQPRMDLVGIRTMEHCRRWGIVGDVERSDYPRDLVQDNVYLTHLGGYELGREQFPSLGDDVPPPVSPQKRERCPQNLFDPILRTFAAAQSGVTLRYRTRLISFRDDDDARAAIVADRMHDVGPHDFDAGLHVHPLAVTRRLREDGRRALRRRKRPGGTGSLRGARCRGAGDKTGDEHESGRPQTFPHQWPSGRMVQQSGAGGRRNVGLPSDRKLARWDRVTRE